MRASAPLPPSLSCSCVLVHPSLSLAVHVCACICHWVWLLCLAQNAGHLGIRVYAYGCVCAGLGFPSHPYPRTVAANPTHCQRTPAAHCQRTPAAHCQRTPAAQAISRCLACLIYLLSVLRLTVFMCIYFLFFFSILFFLARLRC